MNRLEKDLHEEASRKFHEHQTAEQDLWNIGQRLAEETKKQNVLTEEQLETAGFLGIRWMK